MALAAWYHFWAMFFLVVVFVEWRLLVFADKPVSIVHLIHTQTLMADRLPPGKLHGRGSPPVPSPLLARDFNLCAITGSKEAYHNEALCSPKRSRLKAGTSSKLEILSENARSISLSQNPKEQHLPIHTTTRQSSMSNFNTPAVNKDCPNVDNFLYDPSNCDEGYWCGCADPKGENCLPSNDISSTQWAGHYTDPDTNEVFTGWASNYPSQYFECPDTLYCPGNTISDNTYCPQLCEAGYFCPTPSNRTICPSDSFCLIGSTAPTACYGMQGCNGQGNKIYSSAIPALMIIGVTAVAFAFLLVTYRMINGLFPFRTRNTSERKPSLKISDCFAMEEGAGATRKDSHIRTPAPTTKIDVAFKDLSLTLKNGKTIMNGVSGALKSGQFTAIMGPSGAGKSTFLSLLSGKNQPTGGTLLVNGKQASLNDYQSLVGFVPQEDVMLRELTVQEIITHSANMRLPSDWSKQQKKERVFQVMESLNLLNIKDSIIGDEIRRGVSGGQRKRVNVAMELVADPSLLALDEPTSGLDSTSSQSLTETLHDLAKTGVNVVAVLHQPKYEIFEIFDNVLLLGVGGRTVYLGPAQEMTAYFTRIGFPLPPKTNPADYYMDVVAGLIPCESNPKFVKEDLFDLWATAPENPHSEPDAGFMAEVVEQDVSTNNVARSTPGFFQQTYLLYSRAVRQRIHIPQNTFFPIILSVFAGIIIGLTAEGFGLDATASNVSPIYYGIPTAMTESKNAASQFLLNFPISSVDNVVGLWQNTALIILLVSVLSINVFGNEQAVFVRDRFAGASPLAYWLAKTLETCAIWVPLYAAIFASVAFAIQPLTIVLWKFWVVCYVAFLGFFGIGFVMSLAVGPANRGITTLVVGLLLSLVFTGALFSYGKNENPLFLIFFPFWVAQGYSTESYDAFDGAFDVSLLNSQYAGYDLSFTFAENMLFGVATGLIWHLLALILLYRKK